MPDRPLPGWPRALGEEDAATYVGLSVSTLRRQVEAGDAPSAIQITPGRRVWLREDLDAWLDRKAGRAPALQSASLWDG